MKIHSFTFFLLAMLTAQGQPPAKPRARDLGIPFPGKPGPFNAITDIAGVQVGYSTLVQGYGPRSVRTGVKAILPKGNKRSPVYASWYSLNGNGELTGTTWIQESGFLETPIMITNTNSVGTVRDATTKWMSLNNWYKDNDIWFTYPVVGETYDGFLNDILGFHVQEKHAFEALNSAKSGPIAEGNVGGGTGMVCLGFKGGTGTSSRVVSLRGKNYTVGALVQSNFGGRQALTITGIPVGRMLMDTLQIRRVGFPGKYIPGSGSIIVVVGTDAPLLPHQLKRIAQRVPIGIGRVGGIGGNSSGDIFITFSTANEKAHSPDSLARVQQLPNDWIDPLFEATIQSVEEAIINAMTAAETTEGIYGNTVYALPHNKVKEIMSRYRFTTSPKVYSPANYPVISLTESQLKTYTGTYGNSIDPDMTIRLEAGKLYWVEEKNNTRTELQPVSSTDFLIKDSADRLIRFDSAKKALSLLYPAVDVYFLKK